MTRRALLLGILTAGTNICTTAEDVPDTPRNRVALAGNRFHEAYKAWADRWNRMTVGTLDMGAIESFSPLGGLWRDVEHKFRKWIQNQP